MPQLTYREILNNSAMGHTIFSVLQLIKYGDMLAGVKERFVTQTAAATADRINLRTIGGTGVVLPKCRPGSGHVVVRAGGTSAAGQWRIGGSMGILVPAAGLTVAGADGNGGVTITPRSGFTDVRYAQYVPAINEANVLTRSIFNAGREFFVRIATTDGSTVAGTETATAIAAALNANAAFAAVAVAAATGTGASEVRAQGATVRSTLPSTTGTVAAVSYDGTLLIFPTTVTDAVLTYDVAPDVDLDTTSYPPGVF